MTELKQLSRFVLAGCIFIAVSELAINTNLFLSKIMTIVFSEIIFLVFIFFLYRYLFSKIKNIFFSYVLFLSFAGALGFFIIDFVFNKNRELGFWIILFMIFLRAIEFFIARIAIDNKVEDSLREIFLKRTLLLYLVYVSFGLFGFFAYSSKEFWNFGFILLNLSINVLLIFFLFRLVHPRKIKIEKSLFDDVTFY